MAGPKMMKLAFCLGTILLVSSAVFAEERPLLEVPGYGTLLGEAGKSFFLDRTYYGFHGLFYAKEPTYETRFLPPVPVDPMPEDEIYDAGFSEHGCSQNLGGRENCLVVNVYTPSLPMNASDGETFDNPLPVMVFFHGGAFSVGGAITYLPTKFMDQDVVLVVAQYRLGALGFLCLDTDEVPGNAGLFDQVEALRWVQKNIKYFGGDPNLVTIFGESAGSASVSHHLLSPLSRGLFHRVIGESGAALAEWALDRDSRKHSLRIAELAGCPLEPYADLLDCLRSANDTVIVDAYDAFEAEDRKNGGLGFGGSSPVMQKAGAVRFLEDEPLALFESGNYVKDVPIMFGANKHEGTLVMAYLYNAFMVPNNLVNDTDFFKFDMVPILLKALGVRDDARAVADAVIDKYLEGAEMGNFDNMLPGVIDLLSVFFLKAAGYRQVQLHSRHNPGNAYWYSFDFEGQHSLFFYLFFGEWPPIWHGVGHADELIYLFQFPFLTALNETERTLSSRMIQLWTNFAKYGNPTPDGVELVEGIPKWPAYSDESPAYITLDENLSIKYDYTEVFTVAGDAAYNRPKNKDSKTKRPSELLREKLATMDVNEKLRLLSRFN